LMLRELTYMDSGGDGKPYLVKNFSIFSSRDMAEIRTHVQHHDPDFDFVTILENPKTGQTVAAGILDQPDFFYPQAI